MRILFLTCTPILICLTIILVGCSGKSAVPPGTAPDLLDLSQQPEPTWPDSLPCDITQPWEVLDAYGKVVAGINADSEFLSGVERVLDTAANVSDNGEAAHIESGDVGSGTVSWVMYRVLMGGEQPGVVSADVNPGEMSDGNLSSYYVGLSNYGEGSWDWHGPFNDSHVRISTGAEVAAGGDYLSDLGNHFVCIVAFDGAIFDVVGVSTNAVDPADTEAPPTPMGFSITPVYGGFHLNWSNVIAGDLAGYRVHYGSTDWSSGDEACIRRLDYLLGQCNYLLTGISGETYVQICAVDISGNESALTYSAIDTPLAGLGPALRLGVNASSGLINESITLTAKGAVNYAWDLDGDGVFEVAGDTTGIQPADTGHTGILRPSVRGTTDDGSCVATAAVSLIIAGNSRPVANAYAAPTTGNAPLLVSLTGAGIDDDGTLVSYSWDFDGDGAFDQTDLTDPGPVAHLYETPGLYNAKFRVEDDMGSWDIDTVAVLVSPPLDPANTPPTAVLSIGAGEESGDTPHSVSFDASGSSDPDAGDSIVRYWWDLDGDGSYDKITISAAYTHIYSESGSFNAIVVVEDSQGATDTDSVVIDVNMSPMAVLYGSPLTGKDSIDVAFSAADTFDSDGSIADYEWDFDGDGTYNDTGEEADNRGNPAPPLITYLPGIREASVRVTDDQGATDTASLTVTVHGWMIRILDTAGLVGQHTSMALVDGTPAVSYYELTGLDLRFVRAADANGNTWGAPVQVSTTVNMGEYTSLAVVNGNPAISCNNTTSNDLMYVRATDSSGSNWGTPVTVDLTGAAGKYTSLAVVDGNPAISYYNDTSDDLMYVRATDASGGAWGTPQALDTAGSVGLYTSLAIVDGNPAISYSNLTSGDLMYVRATDAQGSSWGSPLAADTAGFVGWFTSLAVVDGSPAISYYDSTSTDLNYVRATDAQGGGWGTPVAVDTTDSVGRYTSLAVIDGLPAISYFDDTNHDLKYVRASDASGNTWGTPETVDSVGWVGEYTSLLAIDGFPAISYFDNSNIDLKFARKY